MDLKTCRPCYDKIPLIVKPKYLLKLWNNYRIDMELCQQHYDQLPDFMKEHCIDMSGNWGYVNK